MRFYQVSIFDNIRGGWVHEYVTSKQEIPAATKRALKDYEETDPNMVSVATLNIPTDKKGLRDWLNNWLADWNGIG